MHFEQNMTVADTIQCALALKPMRACSLAEVVLNTNYKLIRQDEDSQRA